MRSSVYFSNAFNIRQRCLKGTFVLTICLTWSTKSSMIKKKLLLLEVLSFRYHNLVTMRKHTVTVYTYNTGWHTRFLYYKSLITHSTVCCVYSSMSIYKKKIAESFESRYHNQLCNHFVHAVIVTSFQTGGHP